MRGSTQSWIGRASLLRSQVIFLQTSITLATTDSLDLHVKDADMILEAKVAGDHFKSNFYEICG
jgi:hypothetical protein